MYCYNFKINKTDILLNAVKNLSQNTLVLFFCKNEESTISAHYNLLRNQFPKAMLVGCSSGNQIFNDEINTDETTALALEFEQSRFKLISTRIKDFNSSFDCGKKIALDLQDENLKGLFILSDGLQVNGSQLIAGINSVYKEKISISGGLAADNATFQNTYVCANSPPEQGIIAAIGFYGEALEFGFGNGGGWGEFGPRRFITESENNILYELDGKPALDLYEKYLGEEAKGLPSTALLYPLKITDPNNKQHDIVRTILAIDKVNRTMTFAGDMPVGWQAQLMRGNHENLIDSARNAAKLAIIPHLSTQSAAILTSCIGRKLLMGQKTLEEVSAIRQVFGNNIPLAGFYSYGEISPHVATGFSDLHNQTMTIMTITERLAA